MNSEVWVLEFSDGEFSATAPLLEKKKADRILRDVEMYLVINGYDGFQSSWHEEKIALWSEGRLKDSWFTIFSFKVLEPRVGFKEAINFSLEQALKEEK